MLKRGETKIPRDLEDLFFFFDSLGEERKEFTLPLSHLILYKLLVTLRYSGEIVGIAGLLKNNILFVVVKNGFQNRGIGQSLIKKLIVDAKEKGYSHIALTVFKSNRKAIHIYRKLGFRVFFSLMVDGRDSYFMVLPLNFQGWLLIPYVFATQCAILKPLIQLRFLRSIIQNSP